MDNKDEKFKLYEQLLDSLAEEVSSLSRIVTDGNGSPPLTARMYASEKELERMQKTLEALAVGGTKLSEKLADFESVVRVHMKAMQDFKDDSDKRRIASETLEAQFKLQGRDHKFQGRQNENTNKSKLVATLIAGMFALIASIATGLVTYYLASEPANQQVEQDK